MKPASTVRARPRRLREGLSLHGQKRVSNEVFSLGLDFGTNSVRVVVAACSDGTEIGHGVADYVSGKAGILYDRGNPDVARQHPADYLSALKSGMGRALGAARRHPHFDVSRVVGLGLDATGSSPLPVDARNQPLADSPKWRRVLAAQCWLWKDHSAWREAGEITALARRCRPRYLSRCGGAYSSEWFWAKLLRCLRENPRVFQAAHSWVELGDWVGSVLAGVNDPAKIHRGAGLARLKALYAEEWGGLPDEEFLAELDPQLATLRARLYARVYDASSAVGRLSAEWAEALGLAAGLPIANAGLDCHAGAIGCGVKAATLVKVIGTSGCDCVVLPPGRGPADMTGICGMAPGAILPGLMGVESGQSAVGDIFHWWTGGICGGAKSHRQLTGEAARLAPGQSGLLALDWHNGNRSILTDPRLSGLLLGCTLHTSPAEVYRALIESTAFGARVILENLRGQGVMIRRIVCTGGIAEKNPLLMQIYADVLGCTLHVSRSGQACALGSAVAAAVVARVHANFPAAQRAMTRLRPGCYRPVAAHRRIYDRVFRHYRLLHDRFGATSGDQGCATVMRDLRTLREEVRHRRPPVSVRRVKL